VAKFEAQICELAAKLCERVESYAGKGPVVMSMAYSCFATDVISLYCFRKSYNLMDGDKFVPNLKTGTDSLGDMVHMLKQAPWMHKVFRLIPQ